MSGVWSREASDPDPPSGPPRATEAMSGVCSREMSDLYLLAAAEGRERVAAMVAAVELQMDAVGGGSLWNEAKKKWVPTATLILVMAREGRWELWVPEENGWWTVFGDRACRVLEEKGLAPLDVIVCARGSLPARIEALRSRFDGAREHVRALRDERLRDVNNALVPPCVRVGPDGPVRSAFGALDDWLTSGEQTALVLGEFGMGKSTLLAAWCSSLWERAEGPRPVLVSLATANAAEDAEAMLLEAAGLAPSPQHRAALKLLVRQRKLLPCFDGFDEMATRTGGSLAARLSDLLRVAEEGGKIVIASRDHYFENEARLRSASVEALAQALGESAGLVRMTVQPLTTRRSAR
jgi:antitoxin (DNA-binding transcriptional repressor) of toxin-antitoxin stability system